MYESTRRRGLVRLDDVGRLQTFLTLFDVEFDQVAFVQTAIFVADRLNRRKVNKEIFGAIGRGDKPKAF